MCSESSRKSRFARQMIVQLLLLWESLYENHDPKEAYQKSGTPLNVVYILLHICICIFDLEKTLKFVIAKS